MGHQISGHWRWVFLTLDLNLLTKLRQDVNRVCMYVYSLYSGFGVLEFIFSFFASEKVKFKILHLLNALVNDLSKWDINQKISVSGNKLTAGLNVQYRADKKITFLTNQRDYDKSETTDEKLSARRIHICWVYFCVINFDLSFSQ